MIQKMKTQKEYIKNNLTKDKNCNTCLNMDCCILELLENNINPDKYICRNWRKNDN